MLVINSMMMMMRRRKGGPWSDPLAASLRRGQKRNPTPKVLGRPKLDSNKT